MTQTSRCFYLALVVLLLAMMTTAQNNNQQQSQCSTQFEANLAPECFQKNDIDFQGVIFVLSGNRSGAIPAEYNYGSFLDFVCSLEKQDSIVPCVLQQMQKYNSSQCTEEDRAGVLGRGGQLLAFMDAVCGEPCEQEATQSLIQCYAAINVNPEPILNPNASITDDKFTVIGKNKSEVENYCTNRKTLFNCLGPLAKTCPGLVERLYTLGIDLLAMQTATALLCDDQDKFFRGLSCFSKPSAGISQCREQTEMNMKQVLAGRYQTGEVKPSQYMTRLCETKLTQMDCELTAYADSCDEELGTMKTDVECAMLPEPCRNNNEFKPVVNKICTKGTAAPPVTDGPTVPPGKPGQAGKPSDNDDDDGSSLIVATSALIIASLIVFGLSTY